MTVETSSPPLWIDETDGLVQLVNDLSAQRRIAVDTESNSLHAYRERVCLIQFSTDEKDYLVDPLVLEDLSSLAPIFADPKIEKIFHAAEYDLICMSRDFGFKFVNLFDTMQAARILGYKFVGLDNILAEKFSVKVNKRHQKANWGARPLTAAQLEYASMDTQYLISLRDMLEKELREAGRWDLAQDDFLLAQSVDTPPEKLNGSSWRRFSSRKHITLRELTILSELTKCRDEIAERLDRPPFKVIANKMLLNIAKNLPEKDVDLAGIGLSQKQIRLWGSQILAAVRRGVKAPIVKVDQSKRPEDAVLKRLDVLKTWRKKTADKMKVESDIVLPKRFLGILSEHPPGSIDELKSIMRESPNRFRKFGDQIFNLIGG
ncbi:MAG TPA: HRDC domain-containing protein [Anaerolineales bacterium]|nr:HRDC domain-containing protein [Anaerolineales bacterium]